MYMNQYKMFERKYFGYMPAVKCYAVPATKQNMKKKPVKPLKIRCLDILGPFLAKTIRKTVTNASAAKWYGMLNGDLDLEPDHVIAKQVSMLKKYLWSHVTWYDYNEVFKIILQSVEKNIQITRKSWKPSSNSDYHRREIDHVMAFAEVARNTELRRLDFGDIPNSMRALIIENLGDFSKLHTLVLRAYENCNGQWLFKGNQ